MRILGLDIGEKRIGVAMSDPEGLLASTLTVLHRSEDGKELEAIEGLIDEHRVERIVVGLPLSMNGSVGKQAEKVQAFCLRLVERVKVPVDTWDERLSTVAAERVLMVTGMKRNKRREKIDAVAAAITLQGYLDRDQYALHNSD